MFEGDRDFLSGVRYLITLDADTNLYIGAVGELVGAMLHPENRAVIDEKRGIVISGHAVIQPRMITALDSASVSAFARLTGRRRRASISMPEPPPTFISRCSTKEFSAERESSTSTLS